MPAAPRPIPWQVRRIQRARTRDVCLRLAVPRLLAEIAHRCAKVPHRGLRPREERRQLERQQRKEAKLAQRGGHHGSNSRQHRTPAHPTPHQQQQHAGNKSGLRQTGGAHLLPDGVRQRPGGGRSRTSLVPGSIAGGSDPSSGGLDAKLDDGGADLSKDGAVGAAVRRFCGCPDSWCERNE